MAIAFDASSFATTSGAASTSVSHTCTGSNRILIAFVRDDSSSTTAVTYNGVSMTSIVSVTPSAHQLTAYYLVAPATGANTLSVTRSSSTANFSVLGLSYTGAAQTGQPDASNTNSPASPGAVSVTPVATGSWGVAGATGNANNSTYSSTDQTSRISGQNVGASDSNAVISGATSFTFSEAAAIGLGLIAVSIARNNETFTITETVTGTESTSAVRGAVTTTTETTTLSETIAMARGALFSILDTLSLTDILSFLIQWVRQAKSSTSFSNTTKDASSWTNTTKDASTFTNTPKS